MGDDEQNIPKDGWDKAKIIGGLASATLIPVAVLITGYWVNTTVKNREIAAKGSRSFVNRGSKRS